MAILAEPLPRLGSNGSAGSDLVRPLLCKDPAKLLLGAGELASELQLILVARVSLVVGLSEGLRISAAIDWSRRVARPAAGRAARTVLPGRPPPDPSPSPVVSCAGRFLDRPQRGHQSGGSHVVGHD